MQGHDLMGRVRAALRRWLGVDEEIRKMSDVHRAALLDVRNAAFADIRRQADIMRSARLMWDAARINGEMEAEKRNRNFRAEMIELHRLSGERASEGIGTLSVRIQDLEAWSNAHARSHAAAADDRK